MTDCTRSLVCIAFMCASLLVPAGCTDGGSGNGETRTDALQPDDGSMVQPTCATGSIIMASSGHEQGIQEAVDLAAVGDCVYIPEGTWEFTGEVTLHDGIHILGAGMDRTILARQDDVSDFGHGIFSIDCIHQAPFSFSDMTLRGRGRDTLDENGESDVRDQGLFLAGRCLDFRIHDARFTRFSRAGVQISPSHGQVEGESRGVIYRCEFIENLLAGLGYGVEVYGLASAWGELELGTENAVFIEDSHFERCRHAVASNNASKYVFRHNVVVDNYYPWASIDAHGLGSWERGSRSYEIYENTVSGGVEMDGTEHPTWAVGIRGGDGVIYQNSFSGLSGTPIMLVIENLEAVNTDYPQPDQTIDLWLWGNKNNGDDLTSLRLGWSAEMEEQHTPYLQEGRDYHFDEKPGYLPYTYPHPLR